MSVIKSNMAAIAVYYTKFWCMVTPKFMIAIHFFVFKMHTFKIFQKLNHRNMFLFKKYNLLLELASVRQFSIQIHINFKTDGISRQYLRSCISKTSMETHYFYVLFLYLCKKYEKLNHNFNNTHTSLGKNKM